MLKPAMSQLVDLPAELIELIRRYDTAGPRYTSYPPAPVWREDFGPDDHAERLRAAGEHPADPLSAYVHLPFCEEMCTYCGCNVVITRDHGRADDYIDQLGRELALCAPLLGERRGLAQLHWGGGTPTFLSEAQLERLFRLLTGTFTILPGAEVSLDAKLYQVPLEEVDHLIFPSVPDAGCQRALASAGFKPGSQAGSSAAHFQNNRSSGK